MAIIGKLRFAHRHLWRHDRTYQLAVLAGPALLAGLALAAGIGTLTGRGEAGGAAVPWAKISATGLVWTDPAHPVTLAPAADLAAAARLRPGWTVLAMGMTLDASGTNADIEPPALSAFHHDGATLSMAEILAHGPEDRLFAAVGTGALRIDQPGQYGLALRLSRTDAQAANCSVRLAFGGKPVFRQGEVGLTAAISRTYGPAELSLTPGLYKMNVSLACWSDGKLSAPGEMTVLLRRPGEAGLMPLRAEDILTQPTAPEP